jgi:hypothetical protein
MTPRRVLRVARFLILILTVSTLAGCGPDPAKQALLEQLVTTQSAIAAGVTQVTLREREIALRAAAGLADDRLNGSQREAVASVISEIRETRRKWSLWSVGVEGDLSKCANRLDTLALEEVGHRPTTVLATRVG